MLKTLNLLRILIILFLIGATGLVINPFTDDSYLLPKVVWIKGLVIGLLLIYLALIIIGQGLRLILHPLNLALLIFLLINAISLFWAQSQSLAKENLGFLIIVFIFIFLLQDYLYHNRPRLIMLGWILMVSSLIVSLWTLAQDFLASFHPGWLMVQPRLPDWRGYLASGLGNSNYIAGYIAFTYTAVFIFYLYVRGKRREIFTLITLVAMSAALIVCWSVTANASLAIAIGLVIFFLAQRDGQRFWRGKLLRLGVLAAVIGLLCLFYLVDHPLNPHRPSIIKEAFASQRWKAGWPTRAAIWLNTLEVIKRYPLLGVGTGNFTYAYVQVISPLILSNPNLAIYAGSYTNTAHNELLQSWSELGIAGVACLIFLIAAFFKLIGEKLSQSNRINFLIRLAALGMMSSFLIDAMMNFPLELPTTKLLFFSLLCLPVVLQDKNIAPGGIIMPVELDYKSIKIGVWLENIRIPRLISLRCSISKALAYSLIVLLALLYILALFHIFLPLQSDHHYKKARTFWTQGQNNQAEQEFKKALDLNPEHSDCRSAYTSFLLQHQRYEEAIKQLQLVEKRLVASEIYYRYGLAYFHLGHMERARQYWRQFFRRRPVARRYYPEIDHWLMGQEPLTPGKVKAP